MINMSVGGADGPTVVFLAGKLGWGPFSIFGLIDVILILIPNIIYALTKGKNKKNKCDNRLMNILEQIGRYACMFFMIFNIFGSEFGFADLGLFIIYAFGMPAIIIFAYWVLWIVYFVKERYWEQIALAIIPTLVFLLCGCLLQHYLLIVAAIIFGIAHIYVTSKNRCC